MDEAGAALVRLTQVRDALPEVRSTAHVVAGVAQVSQESDGPVVGVGLFGGDVRLDLSPHGLRVVGQGRQVLGADFGLSALFAPTAFCAAGVGGVEQVGGGSAARIGGRGGGAAQAVQQFGVRLEFGPKGQPEQEPVLFLCRQGGDQALEFFLRGLGRGFGGGGAGLCGDGEQVGIDPQVVRQRALRGGEIGETGRDGRFGGGPVLLFIVVLPFPRGEGGQPGEIQGPQVARGEFVAYADERGQGVVGALRPVAAFILAGQVKDDMRASVPGLDVAVETVRLDGAQRQALLGQSQRGRTPGPARPAVPRRVRG
ncbi:hypothetical protein [Streptomyces violaceusniger]|uniref:hypothetical protein n=1 Tax=Streptomyces violaceusniger TaxID=68280 RepID=UPI00382D287D